MSAHAMPNYSHSDFANFGQDRANDNSNSSEPADDHFFDASNLFGLPNAEEFDFSHAFDFSQPIGATGNNDRDDHQASSGEFSQWIGDLDQQVSSEGSPHHTENTVSVFTSCAPGEYVKPQDTFTQPPNIDPSLFASPQQFQPPATPRYRTDSGSDIPALQGPNGEWLHPRNMRVLDAQELRWGSQHRSSQGPSTYTLPQTSFDPLLSQYQISSSNNFSYPDPAGYAPIDQSMTAHLDEGAIQSVEDQSDSVQSTSSRRESRTTAKALRRQPLYNTQSPKNDKSKPWVRINSATKGNTRTGKTNTYGDGPYQNTLHPLGVQNPSWTASNGTTFRYNQWGELNSVSFEAADIECFLYEHPFHNETTLSRLPLDQQQAVRQNRPKLTLWIQKMPGDSAKRVNTQHGLKCRVRECPAGIYKSRTINTGHFRVAFDEQWATYGETRNPMHVAGYAHLYCMERFFDFAALCRDFDVRADDRELTGEPTGEWIAGLGQGTEQFRKAREFITACKTGRGCEQWLDYPVHNAARYAARKMPHAKTLTAKLIEKKTAATGHSKMRMMEKRGKSATQFFVNKGDLQMQIDAQQERNSTKAAAEKGRRTAKRKMVGDDGDDSTVEEEAADDAYESEGADNGDPEAEYNPRPSKRRRRSMLRRGERPRCLGQDSDDDVIALGERRRSQRTTRFGPAPVAQMSQGEREDSADLLFVSQR